MDERGRPVYTLEPPMLVLSTKYAPLADKKVVAAQAKMEKDIGTVDDKKIWIELTRTPYKMEINSKPPEPTMPNDKGGKRSSEKQTPLAKHMRF
jgi:hypothetical protein